MPPRRAYRYLGLAAGLTLALIDYAILIASGEDLAVSATTRAHATLIIFLVTFSVLGYAVGRLIEARRESAEAAAVITRQLRALEASKAQLVEYETLASLGRLAAGVAHEVRNPLAVIRSASSLLLERLPERDGDARKAGAFICEEIDRLDAFIRALLDFSRPPGLDRRRVAVVEVLERARLLAGPAIAAAGVSVAIDDGDVGEQPVDVDLLAQALAALIVNAADAIAEAEERAGGRVEVSARREGDVLELRVADDGPGVDEAVRKNLFDPFVTTRARGTGLGLPMAARTVRAHGGALELRHGAGLGPDRRGACFVARLESDRSAA
ncbi:MAG: ATP-binding protein [Nannocystaceae bacterium]|nr:hypothetical protein [Myxococcales bacterium]